MANATEFLSTSEIPTNATPHHFVSAEGGIFSGKSILSSPLALFLVQATIIISLSRIIHWGLHKLRQPRVIAEIIGGICLGPSILGNIPGFTETIFPKHSLPTLSLVSSFGLVLYMFLMGLELDTQILFRGIKRFLIISTAGIILPGLMGAAVSYGLYEFLLEPEARLETPFSSFLLFTFVAMAITAFPVLARILTEKKLLSTTVGLMTISAAAIDDICAWILLALVISIINAGDPFTAVYVLAACAAYAAFLLVPVRIFLKKIFEKFLGHKNHILTQVTLAVIFVMIFLSAWTTEWIGVHAIFGAFLIGIIIPRMGGITMELTHKLEDLVGIVFLPLYFASSGLKTKLGLLNDWTTAVFLILVVTVACAGKIIGCTLAAKYGGGFPWREAFSIGILMNTKGLVELIVLNIGLDAGVINDRIFVVMVLMALITTFMTSPLIAFVYPPKYHLTKTKSTSTMKKVRPLALTWPDVDDKILVYLKDIDSVPLMANLLQIFQKSLSPGKQIYLNGLKAYTDFERSSNIMASTQAQNVIENDPTLKMFNFFGSVIGAITKCFVAQSRLTEIGAEVDRAAATEHCDMVLVPWQQDAPSNEQQEATISILNSLHITVAVFVDRRSSKTYSFQLNSNSFVGILITFIGGPSDRLALQLAFRFRNQSNIRLTVLHLTITGQPSNKMDNDLLLATKEMAKEGDVIFQSAKITHDDIKPVLEALTNSHIDLIILGQSKKLPKKTNVENGNNEQKNYSLIRRFSQRALNQEISDEEKIFGSLGSQLYSVPKVPSLLIIHEPTNHTSHAA